MPNQTETLLSTWDKCPPFMAYYGYHLVTGKRLTVDKIAEISGLSRRTVTRVARCRSWKTVRLGVIVAFCSACGIDLFNTGEIYDKLRQELRKPEPFLDLPVRRRASMLALFNMLAASTKAEKERN
jgi:hypothetical protein